MTTKYRIRWEEFLMGERSIEADSEEELQRKFASLLSSAKPGWTRYVIEDSAKFEIIQDVETRAIRRELKLFAEEYKRGEEE